MSFVRYPKGTKLSDGSVADGNTEYNDSIVKPVGSVSSTSVSTPSNSTASQTSTSGGYSIDVGRSQPYTLDKNLVDALKYGIKTGILTPQQAASSLVNGSTGANADALRTVNPVSQLVSILISDIGEVTQGGRVGQFTPQGNFSPTQTSIRTSVTTGQGTTVKNENVGSQYVAVKLPGSDKLAYFNNTSDGLVAVNDGSVIQKLVNGQLQSTSYNSIMDVPSSQSSPVAKTAEDYAKAVYGSGLTMNTNIDESAFNMLSYKDLMSEAEGIVSPYYQERLKTTKSDLQLYADRLGTDLGLAESGILRESTEKRETGRETLADRGLAFSGKKEKFESDLTSETTRAIEEKRTLAFRNAQDALYKAENQVGSGNLGSINVSSPNYNASISERGGITGSDVYDRNSNTRDLARALASDENLRRQEAYNSYVRSLSFA